MKRSRRGGNRSCRWLSNHLQPFQKEFPQITTGQFVARWRGEWNFRRKQTQNSITPPTTKVIQLFSSYLISLSFVTLSERISAIFSRPTRVQLLSCSGSRLLQKKFPIEECHPKSTIVEYSSRPTQRCEYFRSFWFVFKSDGFTEEVVFCFTLYTQTWHP